MTNGYEPFKIYLAAPFEERDWMLRLKDMLESRGAKVTSTWLTPVDGNENNMAAMRDRFDDCRCRAIQDIEDIKEADVVVIYKPKELHRKPTTGGHHVELGLAIGFGIPVIIFGDRENVFHYLPQVTVVSSFEGLCDKLHIPIGTVGSNI